MLVEINLKNSYKNFFIKNKHILFKNSSLIPKENINLLFTNSGMNQFTHFLSQKNNSFFAQIASVQKCVRLGGKHNDMNTIGFDQTHHTLFNMLGNWSFNYYFKKYSILLAIYYILKTLKIPPHRLHFCIYDPNEEKFKKPPFKFLDYESFYYLIKILLINKLNPFIYIQSGDRFNNFWQMGSSGPCGYCTELYFNNTGSNTKFNYFLELWNLVFIKFFIEKGKKIYSLNKFFVDTGLGLERLTGIFNSTFVFKNFTSLKYSNYRGKLYRKYLIFLKNILKIKANYQTRILIDHISTSIELLNAGINVSNSGRGFILKKLIRRLLFYFISYKINFQTINSILKRYSLESNKINAYNRCSIVFKNEYFSLINFEKNAKDFLLKLILKNKTIKKDWTEFVYFVYQTHGLKLIFLKNHINLHRTFINWNLFFYKYNVL